MAEQGGVQQLNGGPVPGWGRRPVQPVGLFQLAPPHALAVQVHAAQETGRELGAAPVVGA
ncbi:hypothetical protein [Streptomyces sp. NBC_00147]|uniref:hypothetical protein n=1 Tax=Streptomyces sp. NBC_00147 TaxID=2975667 RepID=UPI00324D9339